MAAAIRSRLIACSIGAAIAIVVAWEPARADNSYRVAGADSFALGGSDQRGVITYDGVEILKSEKRGKQIRFSARVRYTRIDQGAKSAAVGTYVELLLPNGESQDIETDDPDFLTILNQPFSVQLDPAAKHDLMQLHSAVPFDFPAPMVATSLRGTLQRTGDGEIAGHKAIGLIFSASGPLSGKLPAHPQSLAGQIRLDGRAYYDRVSALLLSLEMTLEINGHVTGDVVPQAVTIVYRRSIRLDPSAVKEARR